MLAGTSTVENGANVVITAGESSFTTGSGGQVRISAGLGSSTVDGAGGHEIGREKNRKFTFKNLFCLIYMKQY